MATVACAEQTAKFCMLVSVFSWMSNCRITKQKSFHNDLWHCNQRHIYPGHTGQEVQSSEVNVGCRASYPWLHISSTSLQVREPRPQWGLVSPSAQTWPLGRIGVVLERAHEVCWIQSPARCHFSIATSQCILALWVSYCVPALLRLVALWDPPYFSSVPILLHTQLFSTFHKQVPHIKHNFAFLNLNIKPAEPHLPTPHLGPSCFGAVF